MREIKFRVWDDKNNVMYLCALPSRTSAVAAWLTKKEFDSSKFPSYFEDGRAILMQYTGLKDKNGKEIYEGDIVSFITERAEIKEFNSAVVFEGGAFVISEGKDYNDTFLCAMTETDSGIEVIGNIYENPELLETE